MGTTDKDFDPRLRTPSVIRIVLTSTLDGVNMRVDGGPSSHDPLGQRYTNSAYADLDAALLAIPEQVRAEVERLKGDKG